MKAVSSSPAWRWPSICRCPASRILPCPRLPYSGTVRGSFVWKLNGDTVTRVGVTILDRHGRSVVVLSDLSDKDQVIVEGVQSLREGIKVARVDQEANIVASDPPAAAAAPATAAGDQGKGS